MASNGRAILLPNKSVGLKSGVVKTLTEQLKSGVLKRARMREMQRSWRDLGLEEITQTGRGKTMERFENKAGI